MPHDPIDDYLHRKVYRSTMGADTQTIPARHGTATFVPAGHTIDIRNTSGTQVVAVWAFALPEPPSRDEVNQATAETEEATSKQTPTKKSRKDFPSQEEAEKATAQGMHANDDSQPATKLGWSSYIPSVNLLGCKRDGEKQDTQQNPKGWSQYLSAGKGFTNYIPTKDSLSAFASSHHRDPTKPYIQQLSDFSKTPVGAAGFSALSGSGYASSLYAGYSAWSGLSAAAPAPAEHLSLAHSRAATHHLIPKVGDTLVSNLRKPLITVLEDTSGAHDNLLPATDPAHFRAQGVRAWAEHGSDAENLVLALEELNRRAGLHGAKGIGAGVTVDAAPQPLNLFMRVRWDQAGELSVEPPREKRGDHVRFRVERDLVVVMSASPERALPTDEARGADAHFAVEEELDPRGAEVKKRLEEAAAERKKKPVRKTGLRKLSRPAKAGTKTTAIESKGTTTAVKGPTKATKPVPQASTRHAPIGTKKTPKTGAKPNARDKSEGLALVRHDSASDVSGGTKATGPTQAAKPAQVDKVAAERKKPRKIRPKAADSDDKTA